MRTLRANAPDAQVLPSDEVSSVVGPFRRLAAVWERRELLANMIRKELKVKYKNSTLGFAWSLLNPALYLVVFYVVFELVLQSGIPDFTIYLLCGLLPWNLFSTALQAGTNSVVANSALVTKVWFPREILPLASVGAAFIHFLLQSTVLVAALVAFRYAPSPKYSVALLPALVGLLLFLSAATILLSAFNVKLRDTSHMVELGLLAWFWFTPIVYQYRLVADRLEGLTWIFLLNPMTSVVIAFQRAIYNRTEGTGDTGILPREGALWYLRNVSILVGVSIVFLLLAVKVFGKMEGDFAEEL